MAISNYNTEGQSKNVPSLPTFKPATSDEVRSVIKKSSTKSCELDAIPTWLLKECIEELLPYITKIVNDSLSCGIFPTLYKEAIIRPHLKKSNLSPDELKNYRPVSNLTFISKVLERIVASRIEEHLTANELLDNYQSAYRTCYSTETALLKVKNDLISSLDRKKCTLLVSLDLSAAFDTVDHNILKQRLQDDYGLQNVTLRWFDSYLAERKYKVCVRNSYSTAMRLTCGVPQGSVLGARMYTLYTRQLSDIIVRHQLNYHSYADDTQIYVECDDNTDAHRTAISQISACIEDICVWMSKNSLKLNMDKTEIVLFKKSPGINNSMKIGNTDIQYSKSVRLLGVCLDETMSMEQQISSTCRSANSQLRKIRSIRQYLTVSAVKILVHALVTSRLDYCNSLYVGLPLYSVNRLQKIQNAAARLITGTSRYEHITPDLRRLHWLPIINRCQFKLLIMTYKILHNMAPFYLSELLDWYKPTRTLRSSTKQTLVPRRHNSVKYGKRLFDSATATLWNGLPHSIQEATSIMCFRKLVKTHLFDK